ncbi:PAS domain-containing sensor histidine kinase [Paenibacillus alkalitolerans]|uniref:PAS domain-containing sensor histidine kinase n=1 Tax=Paenibacillus alkalitolerans TaxID=2799335 RepID=UPI0018F360EA|nr:PAS domain S-box protein [Paenibacillus alkalitolerans]
MDGIINWIDVMRHSHHLEFDIAVILFFTFASALLTYYLINRHVRISNQLKHLEYRYSSLIHSTFDVVAELDPSGNILNVKDKLLGLTKEQEGVSFFDIVCKVDRKRVKTAIAEMIAAKSAGKIQFRVMHEDGRRIYVEAYGSTVLDTNGEVAAVVLVCRDCTEKKRAETALKESEDRYRRLVELSPQPIGMFKDGEFYINPAGLNVLRANGPEDLRGITVFDFFSPEHWKEIEEWIRFIDLNGYLPLAELPFLLWDGSIGYMETSGVYDPQSQTFHFVFNEVTARKRAESALKESEARLRESKECYYQLQSSLDSFSRDLFGVLSITEIRNRLVHEVRRVLDTTHVSVVVKSGSGYSEGDFDTEYAGHFIEQFEYGQSFETIIENNFGHLIFIGRIKGENVFLCISGRDDLLQLEPYRVWLKTIARYVSVLYDNFRVIEDLSAELLHRTSNATAPPWLLRLFFNMTEDERKRLASDLHDTALQEQIIWYRKLDSIALNPGLREHREELQRIAEGLLDVIYQIRLICYELRPPFLKEMGIVAALAKLYEDTQLRSDFAIVFNSEQFQEHSLQDDLLMCIYRINQELLANAAKHAQASRVDIQLLSECGQVCLFYRDNGIGFDLPQLTAESRGMGIYGIKERVRSLEGDIRMESSPYSGLSVFISLPVASSLSN